MLDDASNQTSKFRTKNWVEINDESRGTQNVKSQIKFKITMLKTYVIILMHISLLTIRGAGDDPAPRQGDERDKGVAFKNCAPFTSCISEISDTHVDNCKDIDIVMPLYNLLEYSDNYAKTSGSLWQYYRDEPNNHLADSELFNSKIKITGKTPAAGNEKVVETMVLLRYLSNFWRNIELLLVNCEVNLILTWSSTCVITNSTGVGTFEVTDTKLYVPVVTLSTQENAKLLQQLKSGFKREVNWNKYLSKPELLPQNPNLNHLVEPSFQGANRLFVLHLKMIHREHHTLAIIFQM